MKWPQIFMLVALLFNAGCLVNDEMTNSTLSPGRRAFGVAVFVAIHVGVAAVLHAGGFW